MASNALTNLRGRDPGANRQTDAISRLVEPVAKAVMATPIMGAKPPAWIRPPLQSGFLDFTTALVPFAPTRYHRDALGYVHVQGSIQTTTGSLAYAPIATLPSGYRSSVELVLPATQNAIAATIVMFPDGVISVVPVMAAGDNLHFNFSFLAEQ